MGGWYPLTRPEEIFSPPPLPFPAYIQNDTSKKISLFKVNQYTTFQK